MMKNKIWMLMAMMAVTLASASLTACGDDDDDENGGSQPTGNVAELIKDTTPSQGWSGNLLNGTATYCPTIVDNSDAEDEYDMDYQTYYAFAFENGQCQHAVFEMICPSTGIASKLETAFKNGTWADLDDDDDDDGYYKAKAFVSAQKVKSHMKAMTRVGAGGINLRDLSLPVSRRGKVLYIEIDCLKGKSSGDTQLLVSYWSPEGGHATEVIPNKIITGTWDEGTGKYTNNRLLALNISYEINTSFSNNLLTSYVTTMTFPNTTWAQLMYEEMEEQNKYIGSQIGLYPESSISGRTVKEKAAIYGDVTKEEVLQLIAAIDWNLSRPFFVSFGD